MTGASLETRPERRWWEIAAAAIALGVTLCMTLVFLWAAPSNYESIAGSDRVQLTDVRTGERREPILPVSRLHEEWLDYVTGRSDVQAQGPWFTEAERRHMADVRAVFIAAQLTAVAAFVLLAALSFRAYRRRYLARLLRSAAVAAAVGVLAIGIVAALAFDAAFLLFHEVLFPQGNFLFAPGSNLLVIYPEAYWYGITLRIAVSVVVAAILIAGAAHWSLRASTTRSAIVPSR